MKKIVTAVDGLSLVKKLKNTGKYIVHEQDIEFSEDVLEYISKYKPDIIITKDNLKGKMTKEIYVKQIRLISPSIKIVLITKELTIEYKSFLFSQEVFNIIESDEASFEKIFNMIESKEKQVIYKYNQNIIKENFDKDINIVTKQTIAVFGTSGAGKSYITSLLGQVFSKKIRLNTLVVDMDIQNSALDIYNNLDARVDILDSVMEDINKDNFIPGYISNVSIKSKNNTKLAFITNNLGIYECQNKININHYEKIYKDILNNYDITIFDLPATPFLDAVSYIIGKVNKVFFVVNPNFISMRQAVKYLDMLENVWKIKKENIYIVINKVTEESLTDRQIMSILREHKIIMKINYLKEVEQIINGIQDININNVDKIENMYKIFGLDIEEKSLETTNIYNKLAKKIGVRK